MCRKEVQWTTPPVFQLRYPVGGYPVCGPGVFVYGTCGRQPGDITLRRRWSQVVKPDPEADAP